MNSKSSKNQYNLFFKDFDSVRDIVRSTFIYGGYNKVDYCNLTGVSPRKYEDAMRFMKAVFGDDYCTYKYKGKEKYVKLNYKAFENCANPLAKLAFFKGFTRNDFNCYFYVLNMLSKNPKGLTLNEIADKIAGYTHNIEAIGTIRNSLNALVEEGYVDKSRQGRKDIYYLTEDYFSRFTKDEIIEITDYITFAKDIDSCSIPLYTLIFRMPESPFNNYLKLTDYYPVQILDAELKQQLEIAIKEKRVVAFTYINSKRYKSIIESATPIRLLIGEHGRQYVFCFTEYNTRCGVYRLDRISNLKDMKMTMDVTFDESYLDKVWCASIIEDTTEHKIEIDFDFGYDRMLAQRLKESMKFGNVTETNGIHRFTITIKDYGEMLPMIRSFYGYIVRICNDEVKSFIMKDLQEIGGAYGLIQ